MAAILPNAIQLQTIAQYPDAANGVPYELYDEATARAKVDAAEEIARWIEAQIRS